MRRLLFAAALALAAAPVRADTASDAAGVAQSYRLEKTEGTIVVAAGTQGKAHLKVTPIAGAGAHISPDAPVTVTLKAAQGVLLPTKQKLVRPADIKTTAEQGIEADLAFTAPTAGSDQLNATLVFYICLQNLCERQSKDVSFPVTIQ